LSSAIQTEERRKVQFTGGSTYIISLPKKWIIQNQLKRGSFIKLREAESGALTIIPIEATISHKSLDEASIKVLQMDSSEAVTRKIVSAYLAGYNLIRIKAEKQLSIKQRQEVKLFARRRLVGTEIVTDIPSELSLQVLLRYPELTLQSALRRMSIITSSMHRDAITALKTHDDSIAKEVITNDNEIDRFYLYVARQLRAATYDYRLAKEVGIADNKNFFGYYLISKSIERTADHAVKIAENVLNLKNELSGEITERIERMSAIASTMFERAAESLFKQDYNLAESVIENICEVIHQEREAILSSKMDVEDAANLRLIIESIRRTAEYASDIAEIVLNLAIESILS
jgi:phosphate uptake regulator